MAKLKASANKKARYQVYEKENRFGKNKKKKLEKHLKLHPQDRVAKEALKNIPGKPSRSTHVSSGVPGYKEIITTTIKNGKSTTVVERKIRITRLDKQLSKLVNKTQVIFDEACKIKDELFKQLSLAQSLKATHDHFARLQAEKEERLRKEGKLPKVKKDKQKSFKKKAKQ